jgi:hypothetical protein
MVLLTGPSSRLVAYIKYELIIFNLDLKLMMNYPEMSVRSCACGLTVAGELKYSRVL